MLQEIDSYTNTIFLSNTSLMQMFSLRIFFGKDQNQNFRTKRKSFQKRPQPFRTKCSKTEARLSGILQYTKVTNNICVEKLDFWDGIFFWGWVLQIFLRHQNLQTRWATHGKRLKGLKVAGSVERQTPNNQFSAKL